MNDRITSSITSRELLRREIAEQTECFLRRGGNIDIVEVPRVASNRPIGPVWRDSRGVVALAPGF